MWSSLTEFLVFLHFWIHDNILKYYNSRFSLSSNFKHCTEWYSLPWLLGVVWQASKFGHFWTPLRHWFIQHKQNSWYQQLPLQVVLLNTGEVYIPLPIPLVHVLIPIIRCCTYKRFEKVFFFMYLPTLGASFLPVSRPVFHRFSTPHSTSVIDAIIIL